MKQSSIEWLFDQLINRTDQSFFLEELIQAKKMHKQEIIEFATEYDEYCHNSFVQNQYKSIKSAEQFYENTYKTTS